MDKKKEAFIKIVNEMVFDADIPDYKYTDEELNNALEYFTKIITKSNKSNSEITENGKKILAWLQEHSSDTENMFASKEIASDLLISGRSVSGSMRKLVNDGFVEKNGTNPIQYSLTDYGKNYTIEI